MSHWPHQASFLMSQWVHSHNPGRLHKAATRGRKCTPPAAHTKHLDTLAAWLEGWTTIQTQTAGKALWHEYGESRLSSECWFSSALKAHLSSFFGIRFCGKASVCTREHPSGTEWGDVRCQGLGGSPPPLATHSTVAALHGRRPPPGKHDRLGLPLE